MRANYHTHTWRCNHATGTERQYIEAARDNGIEILGFSDHTPYLFPGDHYSHFRMYPYQLDDYVDTLLALKEEYKGRVQVHVGLELEYYPGLLPKLLPLLRERPIEYLILGQHLLGDEIGPQGMEHYCGNPTRDRTLLKRYVNQVTEAMNSGLFTYLAHPDLFYFLGDAKFYRQQMRQLCREANRCNIPLEINLWGAIERRHYPTEIFWQEAAEENCKVILGRDAHNTKCFYDQRSMKQGVDLVEKYQLQLLETVPLTAI
jgi:histidinol-phosphatase (PHP family)